MAASASRLRIRKEGEITRVEFIDRNILDEANIQQIGEEISHLVDSTPVPKMLINFAGVDHLSSAALGALITIRKNVRGKGGQLRLAEIDPQILEVFKITKLDKMFDIYETSDKALASFT